MEADSQRWGSVEPQHSLAGVKLHTADPDYLAEGLAAVAPQSSIHAAGTGIFEAEVRAFRLPRLGLFSIQMSPAQVLNPEDRGYFSIMVPLAGSFELCERGHVEALTEGSFHLLPSSEPFDLRMLGDARCLVANLDIGLVEGHARTSSAPNGWSNRIQSIGSTDTPEWASVVRFLRFVWKELQNEGALLHSPRVAQEVEEALAAMVVGACLRHLPSAIATPAHIKRAEEFLVSELAAPVSLAEVSEVAGVSARTLSRTFKQRHGEGVMGFLKQRRLEAARRDLLAAERGSTSVTEVALRYGCTHLGRFAAEYRRRFGEYPSETLRR